MITPRCLHGHHSALSGASSRRLRSGPVRRLPSRQIVAAVYSSEQVSGPSGRRLRNAQSAGDAVAEGDEPSAVRPLYVEGRARPAGRRSVGLSGAECSYREHGFRQREAGIDPSESCGHNDYMARNIVGARELKTRLGTYLRRVREGRTLVVTERGEPVAELRPISPHDSLSSALLKLSARGAVTLPTRDGLSTFRPIRSRGESLSEAVLQDREDRF